MFYNQKYEFNQTFQTNEFTVIAEIKILLKINQINKFLNFLYQSYKQVICKACD